MTADEVRAVLEMAANVADGWAEIPETSLHDPQLRVNAAVRAYAAELDRR